MKPLQLPPTIRTAREEEITTPNEEVLKRIRAREQARIVEGYTLRQNPTTDYPFKFFSEINIDNDRLWPLLCALCELMPAEVSLLFGHIDDEPTYGPYMNRLEVLEKLAPYQLELTQDGLLEFGLIYQDEEQLQEVFVKKAKYIQYWGINEEAFRAVMNTFGLKETEGLNFIDQFPMATEELRSHRPGARESEAVVKELQDLFS